jgi:hypothetical protein
MSEVDPSCGCPITKAKKAREEAARIAAAGVPGDAGPSGDAPVTPIDVAATPITPPPVMTPIGPRPTNAIQQCRTVTTDGFWLRPTPTFAHVGHHYPPRTEVIVLNRQPFQSGIYTLFRIRVVNPVAGEPAEGFAAMRLADLATSSCQWAGADNHIAGPNAVLLKTYGGKAP